MLKRGWIALIVGLSIIAVGIALDWQAERASFVDAPDLEYKLLTWSSLIAMFFLGPLLALISVVLLSIKKI